MERERCECCNRIATWSYLPGSENFCDLHVPRGCSCNLEPIDGNYDNDDPSNWINMAANFHVVNILTHL